MIYEFNFFLGSCDMYERLNHAYDSRIFKKNRIICKERINRHV